MDQDLVIALVAAAIVGIVAVLAITSRQRRDDVDDAAESPFAASTEGSKLCPRCGMGNLWTDRTCVSCGAHLKG
jgi:hypothetical protein